MFIMKLQKENLSSEILKLYEEVTKSLEGRTLQVVMQRPPIGNSEAQYIHNDKGNFEIYITPELYSDYIFSHELLHVYIAANGTLPILTSFDKNADETSKSLVLLLNGITQHKWIMNEQRRRNILGEKEFFKSKLTNLMDMSYNESSIASENFNIINTIYEFINNYYEHINTIEESLGKKYPLSLAYAKELFEEQSNYDLSSPFYARRYIVRIINKWIEWFAKDGQQHDFLKREIVVKPVFSERQLNTVAEAVLGMDRRNDGAYCFYTKVDNQKCCPNFKPNINSLDQGKKILNVNVLSLLLDKLELPYYIDDRKGNWIRKNCRVLAY